MAVCADAVLIPEIPYDLQKIAAKLSGKSHGLVVVAEREETAVRAAATIAGSVISTP